MAINFTKTDKGLVMEVQSPITLSAISFPSEYIPDIQNDYRGSSPYHVGSCHAATRLCLASSAHEESLEQGFRIRVALPFASSR